jgi:RND family efflux transporter MFP subunit
MAPIAVELGTVELRRMPVVLTLTGNVVAERQSEVAANVAGRVVSAPIERGSKVAAGQTLIVVDARAASLSLEASTAQAELAKTQAAQGREDCARAERLRASGTITQSDFERQTTQCRATQLQAEAAAAQAGLAAKNATDTTVRAPFAGAVGERYVNVGEYVQPMTRVASLFVYDPVRVTVSVPEAAIARIREGQDLEVRVAAFPDRAFPAKVQYVSPALRAQTRDLVVEARASNPDAALRPGMFATVELVTGDEELATVPEDAIVKEGSVRRLFLARDGKAFELVVETALTRDGRVGVREALTPGAAVIVRPPAGLRDGNPVKAVTASAQVER